ncbi:MAG TPA: DUF4389 domain-containing protein, partial [Gaiellales bacterium]|nr:DUF4389 domain-containing protein [Gaiellales bacterium]
MAYCPNCGAQLPDDARFCPTCGHDVHERAGAGAPPPPGGGPPAPPASPDYPARLEIDYPDRPLNRLTTFFRVFTAIPILILLALLSGTSEGYQHTAGSTTATGAAVGGGLVVVPVVLMLLFRRKYPGWWFDWNRELARFSTRVTAYLALLDDRYPSTDEEQSVHLELARPDGERLSRGLPLVKWLLAIPHYVVLFFLYIAAIVVAVVSWFVILFTGRLPEGLFDFQVGVIRWTNRVVAYA